MLGRINNIDVEDQNAMMEEQILYLKFADDFKGQLAELKKRLTEIDSVNDNSLSTVKRECEVE